MHSTNLGHAKIKTIERLAKRLLSMPHKPREESKLGQRKVDSPAFARQKQKAGKLGEKRRGRRKEVEGDG
jgi:hypothetical protein